MWTGEVHPTGSGQPWSERPSGAEGVRDRRLATTRHGGDRARRWGGWLGTGSAHAWHRGLPSCVWTMPVTSCPRLGSQVATEHSMERAQSLWLEADYDEDESL